MAISDTTRPSPGHDEAYPVASTPAADARTVALNQVAWGAVFAGAVIGLVLQVILNMLGLGLGLATVDPTGNGTPSAGSLGLGAGLWFVVSGIIAAAASGYFGGRLSGKPSPASAGHHGLIAWAVSTLVVVYLLSSAVGGIVSGAGSVASGALGGMGSLLGGSVKTAAQAAAPSLSQISDPFSAIEGQVRGNTGSDPAALKDAAVGAMRAAVSGDASQQADAQEKAAQALARAQNISVEQARTQVKQYTQQFQDTVVKAKAQAQQVADATARAASQGALYGALALILGALAAFFAGRGGAVDRNPELTVAPSLDARRG